MSQNAYKSITVVEADKSSLHCAVMLTGVTSVPVINASTIYWPLLVKMVGSRVNKGWQLVGGECIDFVVEGVRPRGWPKRTWKEVVEGDMKSLS